MICSLDEIMSPYVLHAGSIYIGEQPSEDFFFISANQTQELPIGDHVFFVHSEWYDKADKGPSKRFQMIRFLEIDQLETRIANGGHVC